MVPSTAAAVAPRLLPVPRGLATRDQVGARRGGGVWMWMWEPTEGTTGRRTCWLGSQWASDACLRPSVARRVPPVVSFASCMDSDSCMRPAFQFRVGSASTRDDSRPETPDSTRSRVSGNGEDPYVIIKQLLQTIEEMKVPRVLRLNVW